MKLLTDFDGVLTAQDEEAAAVGARFAEIVGDEAIVERLRAEVRAEPREHGWLAKGQLACYADEDPYVFHNACAAALFAHGPKPLLERLRGEAFDSAETLALCCFEEGTARYRAAHASHAIPEALEALRALVAAGHEVVVVSNSSTDRIAAILGGAGLDVNGAGLRVRGGARKFVIGDAPAVLPAHAVFGGRIVALRRPHYFEIVGSERPDVLVGDVLSLDVAMPSALRRGDPRFASMRVFLKRHPHTPPWSLRACEEHGIEPVDSFAALARQCLR